jgi:hypothetical protein
VCDYTVVREDTEATSNVSATAKLLQRLSPRDEIHSQTFHHSVASRKSTIRK